MTYKIQRFEQHDFHEEANREYERRVHLDQERTSGGRTIAASLRLEGPHSAETALASKNNAMDEDHQPRLPRQGNVGCSIRGRLASKRPRLGVPGPRESQHVWLQLQMGNDDTRGALHDDREHGQLHAQRGDGGCDEGVPW